MTSCEVRELTLPGGRVALVDADDFDMATAGGPWRLSSKGPGLAYVQSHRSGYLHRLVTGAQPGEYVDHLNGDPLDNRKENLRRGTQRDNLRNRRPTKGSSSKYLGVSWASRRGEWEAYLCAGRHRRIFHGYFNSETAAAQARDEAARRLRPDTRYNFPRQGERGLDGKVES